ncbi:MAG: tetratricopeptide repeat protein [Cyanobacteria bacterium P01_H01_bin.153]
MPPTDLEAANQYELRKLVLSIEAQPQQLGLLLAVCDDRNLQARLIDDYEVELEAAGLITRQVRLSHQRPSLKAALTELVEQEPALQTGDPAVVTVLNAGELLGVRLTEEKSEQEKFFFSLQWTREALLQFNFPIVLWLPDDVATRLAQRAPDFWSWRSGVFEFAADPPNFLATVLPDDPQPLMMSAAEEPTDTDSQIPIADLEQQIDTLTEFSSESPLLTTLHNTLGDAYQREYRYQDALAHYQQALTYAQTHQDEAGQANSLRKLGNVLNVYGRSARAIPYYQEAIALYQQLEDVNAEAITLNQLGIAYSALGQYQQAIKFQQQSLKIAREIHNRHGEANSLGNMGVAYRSLGQYRQAIDFHQQSLKIAREVEDYRGEANSLGNLGNAYRELGQYQQAIEFYQQSLKIAREIDDHQGAAAALGNLGIACHALGWSKQAIKFYQKTLEIAREIGDRQSEANSLGNLGLAHRKLGQYQQAINLHQQHLKIAREIGDRKGEADALGNLGLTYRKLGQHQQVIDFHQQSLEIAREIGDRRGEAISLFNIALALEEIDNTSEVRSHYEAAKAIFNGLGLQDLVERCEAAIQALKK